MMTPIDYIKTYQKEIIIILVVYYVLKRTGILSKLGTIRDNAYGMAQYTLLQMGYERDDVADTMLILKGDIKLLFRRWKNARTKGKTHDKIDGQTIKEKGKNRNRKKRDTGKVQTSLLRSKTRQIQKCESGSKPGLERIPDNNQPVNT